MDEQPATKQCPFCAEEIRQDAIVCRFCGRGIEPSEAGKSSEPPEIKNNGCLISLAIFVVVISIIFAVTSRTTKKQPENMSDNAWYACRVIIEQNLKAPSTAKFQTRSTGTVRPLSDGTYDMTMWVDAQNSFGAQIRSNFYCHVKKSGSNWIAIELDER